MTTPLPKSVEQQYRKKCIELKKRIRELEQYNDKLVQDIEKKKKAVERVRMERALLTEILENHIPARTTESEGSPSPPPTV
jgi:non-histone protein 10